VDRDRLDLRTVRRDQDLAARVSPGTTVRTLVRLIAPPPHEAPVHLGGSVRRGSVPAPEPAVPNRAGVCGREEGGVPAPVTGK